MRLVQINSFLLPNELSKLIAKELRHDDFLAFGFLKNLDNDFLKELAPKTYNKTLCFSNEKGVVVMKNGKILCKSKPFYELKKGFFVLKNPKDLGRIRGAKKVIVCACNQKDVDLKAGKIVAIIRPMGLYKQRVYVGRSLLKNGSEILYARETKKSILPKDGKKRKNVLTKKEKIVFGIKSFFAQNVPTGAIIGLSGGIDSAVVASLCVEALGKDKVELVFMPSRYTTKQSHIDAKDLAKNLGIDLQIVGIDNLMDSFDKTLSLSGVARENIQARIRACILSSLANMRNLAVISTTNKTELAFGYITLCGDLFGALAPLRYLLKKEVYELGEQINTKKEIIPRSIITKAPSAELAHNQTDEQALASYDVLDAIVDGKYIKDEDLVKKFMHIIKANAYKRDYAPKGIKFGKK